MRSSFIRLFPHGRCYSLYFYYFYIQEISPGAVALASFSLCFCVPASSLLFCDYYRFFHRFTTLFIANLCFFYCFVAVVYHEGILIYMCFPGMRSSFIRLFPHGRCYSLHIFLLLFIPQSLILGTIALVFRFAFTDI